MWNMFNATFGLDHRDKKLRDRLSFMLKKSTAGGNAGYELFFCGKCSKNDLVVVRILRQDWSCEREFLALQPSVRTDKVVRWCDRALEEVSDGFEGSGGEVPTWAHGKTPRKAPNRKSRALRPVFDGLGVLAREEDHQHQGQLRVAVHGVQRC